MVRTRTIRPDPDPDGNGRELVSGDPYRAMARLFTASPDAILCHKTAIPFKTTVLVDNPPAQMQVLGNG